MTGLRLNFTPLKEPLGFLRVLEWIFGVFAFATCGGYSGKNVVSLWCGEGRNDTLNVNFAYPFKLSQEVLVSNNSILCNRTVPETRLVGDSSSSAEFFVAIAVLAFLYCIFALVIYIGYMHIYRDSNLGPMVDFFITVIFAFLWLVCSSAWARGLHNVKYATGLEGIKSMLSLCNEVACYVTQYANMRGLNVSAVLGFLNCLLWSGNGWFVYKETSWHADHQRTTAQQGPGRRTPPARV